jgi:putative ABC transport system permease protein
LITTIGVKVKDISKIAAVSAEMEKIPDIQVVTMTQVLGTIMNLAGSARSLLLTVIAIALIISAFGIINTLLMSVNERTREFGMMKAIGASGLDIGKMVLIETVFITLSGGVIGTISAIVGSSLIEGFVKGILPYSPRGSLVSASPELIAFALAFSLVLGLICGLYPAFKSSRLTPMEAIRGGIE